ncbi:hypothetical protein PtB15_9B514 [Puccinia triticina]|nr:hypothetical protein PtB15_9B514 [Puccinia triticina]
MRALFKSIKSPTDIDVFRVESWENWTSRARCLATNAARQFAEKSLSKASVGACTLTLVSPKDRVLAKDV